MGEEGGRSATSVSDLKSSGQGIVRARILLGILGMGACCTRHRGEAICRDTQLSGRELVPQKRAPKGSLPIEGGISGRKE